MVWSAPAKRWGTINNFSDLNTFCSGWHIHAILRVWMLCFPCISLYSVMATSFTSRNMNYSHYTAKLFSYQNSWILWNGVLLHSGLITKQTKGLVMAVNRLSSQSEQGVVCFIFPLGWKRPFCCVFRPAGVARGENESLNHTSNWHRVAVWSCPKISILLSGLTLGSKYQSVLGLMLNHSMSIHTIFCKFFFVL